MRTIRTCLWPTPGKSTHGRIVATRGWRVVRPVAYTLIAGFVTWSVIGVAEPDTLDGNYLDGVQVVTVR
jgi:hypothetical protein